MNVSPRTRRVTWGALLIAVLMVSGALADGQEAGAFKGRSLADALRALQATGLRIVFTSATVTPDLIVQVEPRATSSRQQLDELLAAHGLKARDGPGGIIQVVRAGRTRTRLRSAPVGTIQGRVVDAFSAAPLADVAVRVDGGGGRTHTDVEGSFILAGVRPGARTLVASKTGYSASSRAIELADGTTVGVTVILSPAASSHSEFVTVRGPSPSLAEQGVASATSFDRSRLERLHGSLDDDPARVVHAFPGAAAVDDYRSEFVVRGSPFRHVDLVVDGVPTQWLQHTAAGRGATGSFAMLTGQVLADVTLRAGAYPHRYGDKLGPQLDLTIREGSRTGFRLRGIVGGTNATLLGEGPLGGSARGSWLVAARQSYLEWPTQQAESTRTAFGFSDVLAKLVFDVRPTQQAALSVLRGTANVDGEDEVAANELGDGRNRASMVNLSWRSTLGSSAVVRQRAYLVSRDFLNRYGTSEDSDRGSSEEIAYRADVSRSFSKVLLEAGAYAGRTAIDDAARSSDAHSPAISESAWLQAAYTHLAWAVTPSLTLSPGLRVAKSTLLPRATVTPWLLGEWTFRPGWTVNGSAGVSRQPPELGYMKVGPQATELRAERATHFDVALAQRPTSAIRWQITLFSRAEDDILREPEVHPRLVDGVLVPAERGYENALQGTSRGVELLLDRQSPSGASGWVAYSFGRTRYTDVARRETFWGDFDQRHALNVFGAYRFSGGASVGATFRAGSNFPIPGYLAAGPAGLVASSERNRVRLPVYARLDLRADRRFEYLGRRLTLFVEVLNVLDRTNVGLANGSIDPDGQAVGFTDTLLRRRPSAGILIEF